MTHTQCMLEVGVLGINHKTGNLLLREMMARASECLFFVHRIVVLSTCNRTEIYFSTPFLAEAHCDLLCALRKMISIPFEQQLYSYFGVDCFTHLCRVTAGLDSAIVAETEIQRQVKLSYQQAALKTKLPSPLHFLFQKALKVAKEVRSQQKVSPISLPKILWKIIEERFSERHPKTLFIGNSQINREVMDFFKKKNCFPFDLCSQSGGGVERSVLSRWDDYDLIIAGTRASSYLLQPKIMDPKPRLIFDLSVPRNVDPTIGLLEKVVLFNIEQIHGLIEETSDLERSNALLRDNVHRLLKFRMARITRERDYIANVLHPRNKEEESLKA